MKMRTVWIRDQAESSVQSDLNLHCSKRLLVLPSVMEKNTKILDQTKLKPFADNKLNVTKMIIFVFDGVEKHCGKKRNCLYKQFLLFPQCFRKAYFPDPSKGVTVWE